MRGLQALALVSFIAVLGVGIWQAKSGLPKFLSPTIPRSVASTPKASKEACSIHTPRKRRLVQTKAVASKFATLDRLAAEAGGSTLIVVPIPSMPTANSIRTGTTGTELYARYGQPALKVSAQQDGHLVERYYYLSDNQTMITVASLQDGVVASAETVVR